MEKRDQEEKIKEELFGKQPRKQNLLEEDVPRPWGGIPVNPESGRQGAFPHEPYWGRPGDLPEDLEWRGQGRAPSAHPFVPEPYGPPRIPQMGPQGGYPGGNLMGPNHPYFGQRPPGARYDPTNPFDWPQQPDHFPPPGNFPPGPF